MSDHDNSIIKYANKGLPLEKDELEIFEGIDTNSPSPGECWTRYGVKELTPTEALTILANFKMDDDYNRQPWLYFWDDYDEKYRSGGFYRGEWRPLYGYDFEAQQYISVNYSDAYIHYKHVGLARKLDCSFEIPLYLKGELKWLNAGTVEDLIEDKTLESVDSIQPAFETSLDVQNFKDKVQKRLNEWKAISEKNHKD